MDRLGDHESSSRLWMRTLLLDTDIVSFLFKRAPRAKLYEPHLRDRRLAISFVTTEFLSRQLSANQRRRVAKVVILAGAEIKKTLNEGSAISPHGLTSACVRPKRRTRRAPNCSRRDRESR